MRGKRLLILGGAFQHCKLVRAAQELGVYTVVTDYLHDSPAKKLSDKSYQIDIKDINALVQLCREEHIDGIISTHLDPCQRPYQQICDRLGLPCYGTDEQFCKMTDKRRFKQLCSENGVDVVPGYTAKEVENDTYAYPVLVKPTDSRGSRGQTVCNQKSELPSAIALARKESPSDGFLIEKYMRRAHEIQVTYFFIDGEPYLIRTTDSYCGSTESHMEKVVTRSISPSRYTSLYLSAAHTNVVKMLRNLGVRWGPAFMQAFEDHGRFYFFDPGLRFPGVDYELTYQKVYGIDLMKFMVQLALTGNCHGLELPVDSHCLAGKQSAVLFPLLRAGIVGSIIGEEQITDDPHVISYQPRCHVGDKVEWTYDVNHRLGEIQVLGSDLEDLENAVSRIKKILQVRDSTGRNMLMYSADKPMLL